MIQLRDYTETDCARLAELANNKNVSQHLVYTFPYPYTKEDATWWISTGSKEGNAVTKAIEYHGKLVGTIGIAPQTGWKSHSAEIGYWLGEAYWGKDIATQALKLMAIQALTTLNFKKLFAPVLAPNKASMRVLEKCGFELEGVLKQEVFKNGKYFDGYYYGKYRL